MALPMPSPQKHPKTGVYWFRQRVPPDLRAILGKTEVTRSLGTKDPHEAKILHGPVLAEVAEQWANLRRGQQSLSHRELHALAGEFFRERVKAGEDEPGVAATRALDLESDRYAIKVRKSRPGALFGRFGADAMAFLDRRGIKVSTPDLMRFVAAMASARVRLTNRS